MKSGRAGSTLVGGVAIWLWLLLPSDHIILRALLPAGNQRLVTLGKRRLAKGCYGRRNAGWRELYDGFVADRRVGKLIRKGLFRWWRAELTNLRLIFARDSAAQTAAQSTAASTPVAAPL